MQQQDCLVYATNNPPLNSFWKALLVFCFLGMGFCHLQLHAQNNKDTLLFNKGNYIIGEIKKLDKGIITIETDYSDSDFKIEWDKLHFIHSGSRYLITLRNGTRIVGKLQSDPNSSLVLITKDGEFFNSMDTLVCNLPDIVNLIGLEDKFWSRAKASIDVGFNLTKANNLRQINSAVKLGYTGDRFLLDNNFQLLKSGQDSVSSTSRIDAGINFNYYLPGDWFLSAAVTFLNNTEQAIKLRTTGKIGGGKYFIHTNSKYISGGGGISFNNESFSNETETRNSFEAFVATEINLFDIGDFELYNSAFLYRSLTENRRWRSDIKIISKYDLPLDFYLKLSATLNYDNKPAIAGKETDYVFTFGFGWEL